MDWKVFVNIYSFKRPRPLFVVYVISGLLATLKPYPSIADASLSLAFLSLFPEVLKCKSFFYK